jgi:hypothetical protein
VDQRSKHRNTAKSRRTSRKPRIDAGLRNNNKRLHFADFDIELRETSRQGCSIRTVVRFGGRSNAARIRFEPFGDCVVLRPSRKFQSQSAVDALHKTPFCGHHDPKMMPYRCGISGWHPTFPPLFNSESLPYPSPDSLLCPSVSSCIQPACSDSVTIRG